VSGLSVEEFGEAWRSSQKLRELFFVEIVEFGEISCQI
jgi:hypothetical protein